MTITPEAAIAYVPIDKLGLPPTSTAVNTWDIKNLNIPAQVEPSPDRPAEPQAEKIDCTHPDEVMLRIDPDEIGEWDFIPTRAIVCLGCEAVRWA